MSIIYVLIPLAILLVALAIGIFFWAVRSNQFQDLERQGYSILFDDDLAESKQPVKPEKTEAASDNTSNPNKHD
ncbi:cbb3-type cytochrome oxidase assembly protein CcoS [Alteromonas sp. AMM-1]|uniref:cbb3-type cytochrome oxidase assembly protein CcoS n=1 Tax=Alteromonas sp. AMM-1 TaxID=3394233 RepID=UPI0039A55879